MKRSNSCVAILIDVQGHKVLGKNARKVIKKWSKSGKKTLCNINRMPAFSIRGTT